MVARCTLGSDEPPCEAAVPPPCRRQTRPTAVQRSWQRRISPRVRDRSPPPACSPVVRQQSLCTAPRLGVATCVEVQLHKAHCTVPRLAMHALAGRHDHRKGDTRYAARSTTAAALATGAVPLHGAYGLARLLVRSAQRRVQRGWLLRMRGGLHAGAGPPDRRRRQVRRSAAHCG